MTDREKLTDLIQCVVFNPVEGVRATIGSRFTPEFIESIASHLICNGVTVQKWIPVTERLPELIPCNAGTAYSDAVIVWTDRKKAMIAVWDGIDFLCAADYWEAWGENITHWMPLPKLPEDGGAENA